MKMTLFDAFVDQVEKRLDSYIDGGEPQDLFVSGYLHGHFSLSVSEQLLAGETEVEALKSRMDRNLNSAFNAKELELSDQKQVLAMWNTIAARLPS